ncbi:terpenoid cyclases/protein prenyltransferase alpha-alpha toroid [Blastocladiella britannica]|nr:terpenoid cyclases/protein prenyltransferase alpha-alpha toroid [Blastocladiella britannica]
MPTYYAKHPAPPPRVPIGPNERTDISKWRLHVDDGRQWWQYHVNDAATKPFPAADRYWLSMLPNAEPASKEPETLSDQIHASFRFAAATQTDDGHWAGEYGGPMFLLPGLVIAWYVTGRSDSVLDHPQRVEMVRYLRSKQAPGSPGGWGIHVESPATVFGTTLNYVAMRLLGVDADDADMVKARAWLHSVPGGARAVPSWGKFWLATLGLYDWSGMNPVPPELWLLPDWAPVHPSRMWCHTRAVYLPMGYCYGLKLTYPPGDPLVDALKEELFTEPFDRIDWTRTATDVADVDRYVPRSRLSEWAWWVLAQLEKVHLPGLRHRAVAHSLQLVENEDDNTGSLDLGPVNKAMHLLVIYHAHGPDSQRFKDHARVVREFMWMSSDGMMMNGTNGSQLWDTAFFAQAGAEAGLLTHPEFRPMWTRTLQWLDAAQIKRNAPFHTYRHMSLGAWPFSNRQQSYTVSDCTAEGLKAVLQLQSVLVSPTNGAPFATAPVGLARCRQAVDVLLSLQNGDGGMASYELIRGPAQLEILNPAEVFGNIMIEYSYPECTTASILGLLAYQKYTGDVEYRAADIKTAIARAVEYVLAVQEPHTGGWYGAWGVCYTYATWFAVESLAGAGGLDYGSSDALRRGCDFIASKQREDGGWGESYKSCERHVYVEHPDGSQVVNTAWAVLALMRAGYPHWDVIHRGIELIASRQLRNGSWPQEGIEGVFNKNCMISYPNYKLYFTAWALARYVKQRGDASVVRDPVSGKVRRVATIPNKRVDEGFGSASSGTTAKN